MLLSKTHFQAFVIPNPVSEGRAFISARVGVRDLVFQARGSSSLAAQKILRSLPPQNDESVLVIELTVRNPASLA